MGPAATTRGRCFVPKDSRRSSCCRIGAHSRIVAVGVRTKLSLFDSSDLILPPNRGRLRYDFEIPDAFFRGLPGIEQKVRWAREHLPREHRIKIGQKSAWYEADIRAFLESRRAAV